MISPVELARTYTGLDVGARQHLERLMGTWSMLADLSFADLLLYVPVDEFSLAVAEQSSAEGGVHGLHFVVLGQMRPSTNQTLFEDDRVGQVVAAGDVPLVLESWRQGVELTEDRPASDAALGIVRYQCIPVRWKGDLVAVLTRVWSPTVARRTGTLERTYVRLFERLATMVSAGVYPFVVDDAVEDAPRVGDGVVVLDAEGRISFASPNAVNALHRMGLVSAFVDSTLEDLGVESDAVDLAIGRHVPVTEEMERRPDVIILMRVIPLLEDGVATGAVALVRDVTDLRRRDRLLLSKDAAIREVHHRVKNNLQTISSLLRLQSRRIADPAARTPLLEAERRVRAIALVHEILARDPGEQVPFDEIVPALVQLGRDAAVGRGDIAVQVVGDAGELAADVATPLAVVVAELLQNASEHAFVPGDGAPQKPEVELSFASEDGNLEVAVRDNGRGFPADFDLESTRSLGLAIVRDLVRTQLGGEIAITSSAGAIVRLTVPLNPAASR